VTRKLKRTPAYELSLEVRDDTFIRPPHDAQRNWLLNRFLREAGEDLQALDAIATHLVPGGQRALPAWGLNPGPPPIPCRMPVPRSSLPRVRGRS